MPGSERLVRLRADWSFETLRAEFSDSLIKNKPTRIVFAMDSPFGRLAVKALVFDRFEVRLRSLFGRCRTRKEWENHLTATGCNVPTVESLALGEQRDPLLVREAVILTKWRKNTITVHDWRRQNTDGIEGKVALKIAENIGRLTATTQNSSIYHNEIRPENLLIDTTTDGCRVLLIDWKHARIKPKTTENDLQNLVRTGRLFSLELSFAPPTKMEKKAFLKAYIETTTNRGDLPKLMSELKKITI